MNPICQFQSRLKSQLIPGRNQIYFLFVPARENFGSPKWEYDVSYFQLVTFWRYRFPLVEYCLCWWKSDLSASNVRKWGRGLFEIRKVGKF